MLALLRSTFPLVILIPKYVTSLIIIDFFKLSAKLEMFYLNTIEQLFLFVEQLDQLEVCLPYSRLPAGIPILVVFQNLRWNSNKTSLKVAGYFANKGKLKQNSFFKD